ncbi:MAG: hypothetical protein ACRDQ4_14395 [Pseudonocardiaceae bacterium]
MVDKNGGTRVVTLCGVQGCCPTVELGQAEVVLRDDFGGKVLLTREQWCELVSKVHQGELA